VSIADQNMSMDAIINEAIKSLSESGRAHESQQIAQLYKNHTIMSNGKAMDKGSLFKELPVEVKEINGEEIHFAEIELIRMHQGGL
jgi:hypothetical protein